MESKILLLTNLPLFGTVIGELKGNKLPNNGEPYALDNIVSVIISPDGRIGMAKLGDLFQVKGSLTVNAPYVVIDETNPLMAPYTSTVSNIVIPQGNKKIIQAK